MKYLLQFLISFLLFFCNRNSDTNKILPLCNRQINNRCTLLYINRNSCISCIKKLENKINKLNPRNDILIYTNDIELSQNYKINFDTNQIILNQLSTYYNIINNISFFVIFKDGKTISLYYITPENKDAFDI